MEIVYKRLTENELDRIIKMRIDQLKEEYTSEGRTVPEGVDLEASLLDFYKRNMAAERSTLQLPIWVLSCMNHTVLSTTEISCNITFRK